MLVTLIIVVFLVITFAGLYMINARKTLDSNKKQDNVEYLKQDGDDQVIDDTAESETELNEEVSKGDSFNDIESDIEGTVILEEDFSDL